MDGQSQIMRTSGIRRVWITPDDVRAADEAVEPSRPPTWCSWGPAASTPASCPACSCRACARRWRRTAASRLFVCNVATQVGETEGYSLADHVAAFRAHGLDGAIDAVLLNNNFRRARAGELPGGAGPWGRRRPWSRCSPGLPARRGRQRQRPPPRLGQAGGGHQPAARSATSSGAGRQPWPSTPVAA